MHLLDNHQLTPIDLLKLNYSYHIILTIFRNPALEAQAADRIYRVGQTRDVTIHR